MLQDPNVRVEAGGVPAGAAREESRAGLPGAPILSALEAIFLLVVILYYIWVLDPASAMYGWPSYALFMGFATVSHLLRRERPADLGIRLDNMGVALLEALAVVLPALVVGFAIGRFMEGGRSMNLERLSATFLNLYPWALFQQYGLQCIFGRRLAGVLPDPVGHDVVCAGIFAALHLPNPFLTVVTFGAGYCWCVLFRRRPNLFALAASHALSSAALYYCLPPAITHLMRVGPGYLLSVRV
ncbi:MAG: hypothetical protein ACE5JH_05145 [Acidobacteriota bacterium]